MHDELETLQTLYSPISLIVKLHMLKQFDIFNLTLITHEITDMSSS